MKKFLLYALLAFLLMQLYRPKKNNNSVTTTNQMTSIVEVPNPVQDILKRACNDCHSNQTRYLWYHNIAPMSWGVAYHIHEGKEHLNFDEFGLYNTRKQSHAFEEIAEVIQSGEMPMKGYIAFHKEAALSQVDKDILIKWANQFEKR